MALVENGQLFLNIESNLEKIASMRQIRSVMDAFEKDFSLRFCWSSNAIEGNTLSLDETVALIEYDEVRGGHTYAEYCDAKNLYRAIKKYMLPVGKKEITEEWLKNVHGILKDTGEAYREGDVYIGSLTEAVYYPPSPEEIPMLMKKFFEKIQIEAESVAECMEAIARQHIEFERIHPFRDGNGRAGRMLLNQQLINHNLLPVAIAPGGKYRQSFRRYEKNEDISILVHELCKSEMDSIERVATLHQKYAERNVKPEKKMKL